MKAKIKYYNIDDLYNNKNLILGGVEKKLSNHKDEIKYLIDSYNKQKFSYYYPNNRNDLVVIIDNPNLIYKFPKFIQKWFIKTYITKGK